MKLFCYTLDEGCCTCAASGDVNLILADFSDGQSPGFSSYGSHDDYGYVSFVRCPGYRGPGVHRGDPCQDPHTDPQGPSFRVTFPMMTQLDDESDAEWESFPACIL